MFAHTPSIFVKRGIAEPGKLEMASLSAEPCPGASFVMTAFEVEDDGTGMETFREREEEFDLTMVPYHEELDGSDTPSNLGMLCKCGTDEGYIKQWGQKRYDDDYKAMAIPTIWGWAPDSGLRPCACARPASLVTRHDGE